MSTLLRTGPLARAQQPSAVTYSAAKMSASVESVSPEEAARTAEALVANVTKALRGKREVVSLAVLSLLARGHLLVEDVPGVGKTTLARALARSLGLDFRRIQFTSDLMPTDVLGGSIYDPSDGSFVFRPGPIFTHVLLADEINRSTPRTQSALLEAMGERRVSIDGHTHELEEPFFVLATQNPEDFYGTYPLPESQLDRFLVRTRIGYPEAEVERRLLSERGAADPVEALSAVVSAEQIRAAQRALDEVRVEEPVLDYLHEIVRATRATPMLALGASTRAALDLSRAVRARAILEGRGYALCDDVKALAVPTLAHRVRPSARSGPDRMDAERVIADLLSRLPIPI